MDRYRRLEDRNLEQLYQYWRSSKEAVIGIFDHAVVLDRDQIRAGSLRDEKYRWIVLRHDCFVGSYSSKALALDHGKRELPSNFR